MNIVYKVSIYKKATYIVSIYGYITLWSTSSRDQPKLEKAEHKIISVVFLKENTLTFQPNQT